MIPVLVTAVLLSCLTSCHPKYETDTFFEDLTLSAQLVPELPQPQNASFVLADANKGDDLRVYVRSDQTAQAYFQKVLEYVASLSFHFCGTAEAFKEQSAVCGQESSYYFRSTEALSPILANDCYFEEENAYIIIYSNGAFRQSGEEMYLTDAHLLKVCCTSGILKPDSHIGDNDSFQYDYYIEFGSEPSIWLKDKAAPTGTYQLEIVDENGYLLDKASAVAGRYAPDTVLKFYVHPIMDADLKMYVNDEFYQTQTAIRDGDGYIWEYTLTMPDHNVKVTFQVSTLGCYSDVQSILNLPSVSVDEIVTVRYEHGACGIAPGNLIDIKYSFDFEDKNSVLSILETSVYDVNDLTWQMTGGSYVQYSIFTENDQYDIRIENGYIEVGQKHYKFLGDYPLFEYPSAEAHSFITYLDKYEAYKGGVKIGDFDNLSEYEFIEYPYDTLPENENLGYIETEFGKLYIYNENIFYKKQANIYTYYLITGSKNFTFLK